MLGLGDLDGNGQAELILRSSWGLGVLTRQGDTFVHLDLAPHEQLLGPWIVRPDQSAGGVADFRGTAGAELVLR